jgi:hypothetical protein
MLQMNRVRILWGWVEWTLRFEVGGCQTSIQPALEARKQDKSSYF